MKTSRLVLMYILSITVMFITAYSILYSFDHVLLSLNKLYMAILMAGAMGIINTLLMSKMFPSNKVRITYLLSSILIVLISFIFIRKQIFVSNEEFLNSMIPHHSAAVLVCKEAKITDEEIKDLCKDIVKTQLEEIRIMKEIKEKY